MPYNMNNLHNDIRVNVAAAGFDLSAVSLKIKEAAGCKVASGRGTFHFPAYDVYVKPDGAARGRHVLTFICI